MILASLASVISTDPIPTPLPEKIELNRDVRPILSENCFHCHGFDKNTREANRRLDTSDGAFADQDGIVAISPGNLAKSELHHRIISHDKDERMPPEEAGKKLKPREIAVINKWIEQGAKYEPHWAYVPPVKPVPPPLSDANFVRNPVDGFVLARPPRPEEIRVVSELYQRHLQAYEADKKAAHALLQTGFAPRPSNVPLAELAAWTSVARVILNLHETITRS